MARRRAALHAGALVGTVMTLAAMAALRREAVRRRLAAWRAAARDRAS